MKWRWYHGVLFYVGIEVAASALAKVAKKTRNIKAAEAEKPPTLNQGQEYEAVYNSLKQPLFAPPGAVFFPIWLVNNSLATWGLLQVLNKPANTLGRREFLAAHGVFWFTYTTFTAAYFSQRSPIKGAALTDIGLIAALAAECVALFRLKDTKVALSLGTLVPWLLLAAPTATTVALWNRDEFYEIGPVFDAPSDWVKPNTGTESS